jgi:hypothetical protein
MAEWIGYLTHSPAVFLTHRSNLGGTGTHRLIEDRVGTVNHEQRPTRGATNGSWARRRTFEFATVTQNRAVPAAN